MIELTVASMNCRGLGETKKRRDVMNFMRNTDYDILYLQDTHLIDESTLYFDSLWKGKCYHSCYSNRSRGVSILIRNSVQHKLITKINSDSGNFIIVACKIGTVTYLLVNVYGPNDDEPSFYEELGNQVDSIQTDQILIGGDFNFVMEFDMDSYRYAREYNVNAKRKFLEFININGYIDIW